MLVSMSDETPPLSDPADQPPVESSQADQPLADQAPVEPSSVEPLSAEEMQNAIISPEEGTPSRPLPLGRIAAALTGGIVLLGFLILHRADVHLRAPENP